MVPLSKCLHCGWSQEWTGHVHSRLLTFDSKSHCSMWGVGLWFNRANSWQDLPVEVNLSITCQSMKSMSSPCLSDAVNSIECDHVWGLPKSVVNVSSPSRSHTAQWRGKFIYCYTTLLTIEIIQILIGLYMDRCHLNRETGSVHIFKVFNVLLICYQHYDVILYSVLWRVAQ